MISLDSARWSRLSHAYGRAIDTPALLRQLYEGPNEDVWSKLFGTCVHQGSVSEAAYAAAPHVAEAARRAPLSERLDYVVFVASIAAGRDNQNVPGDLRAEYEQAVEATRSMAMELLRAQRLTSQELPHLFGAIAATHRLPILARILAHFANLEFGFVCASCSSDLWVSAADVPFQVYGRDPVRNPTAIYLSIRPQPETIETSDKVPLDGASALPWLLWLADQQGTVQFRHKLLNLYGDGTCPKCGADFRLYDQLESIETATRQ